MSEITSFGSFLKKRRKALDLTQRELAQQVGCAVITLQKIEADQRRPSKLMAERLAEHLGVAVDERPMLAKFARQGFAEPRSTISAQASYRLAWSLAPHCPTNLPPPPTPLIGRDQEVDTIHKRLVSKENYLLTLVGPPGVGKTRLAIQVAASLLDDFEDGVFLIPLAEFRHPPQVVSAIAQTLGVNETANTSLLECLKTYLGDKHLLLVLDNFEQVAAAGLVNQLLAGCPWLSILVTSRTPLRTRREYLFPVPPLPFPNRTDGKIDLAEMESYPALELFTERAQAIQPNFSLTLRNVAAVSTICTRLDGLPLAIELVAARTGVLPPEAILEHLGARLLHIDGLHDVAARHNTLYAAIDWSYALLEPQEKRLLERLGVFSSGWSLQAAESVAGDLFSSPELVLESLAALVNNNLIVQQEQHGEPRFMFLETIRAYALERMVESGEEQAARARHAVYFLALAEEAEPQLRTGAQSRWLDLMELERGNLQVALAWYFDAPTGAESLARLAGALGWFWNMRGYVSEGKTWLTKTLQLAEAVPPALRAKILTRVGALNWPGDIQTARSYLQQSITLQRDSGLTPSWEMGLTLAGYALVMIYYTDSLVVKSAAEEARTHFQIASDPWGIALALAVEGEAYLLHQDYPKACSCYAQSLELFRQTGDRWGMAIPLCNWGYTDSLQGQLDSARERIEQGLALYSQVGERANRAIYLSVLAQIVQQQGDHLRSATLYDESLDLLRKMGLESEAADVLFNLAHITQCSGHAQIAQQLYHESLALFSRQGNEQGTTRCKAQLTTFEPD